MRLHCGFIKGEYLDVSLWKYLSAANQPAIILIFKKSWCIIRLYVVFVLSVFFERLCGLFVVIVCVIDFAVN